MDPINETTLIISEITSGLSGVDMTNYVKCAFILIGILLVVLVIRLIISGINRG
jgi:Na+/proline symporter